MTSFSSVSTFFKSRQGLALRENLAAYAFLSPALILILIFGILPVAFAFFVSLHRWRRFPDEYVGLANYVRSLDNLAYLLFFWLAIGAFAYGFVVARRIWTQNPQRLTAFSALVPAIANSLAIGSLIGWIALLLPVVLDIPQRIRGQQDVPGIFVSELVASFQVPNIAEAGNQFLLVALVAFGVSLLWVRLVSLPQRVTILAQATTLVLAVMAGALILQLTLVEIQAATSDTELPIWTQIIFISAGVALLVGAYLLWQNALKQDEDRRFVLYAIAAVMLVVGGYALALELPRALQNADPEVLSGFGITVAFALGTVPFQLALGLGLACLLFQNIKGRAFFRVVYFLPYIMPFVATSIVFNLIFSHRPASLANRMLEIVGVEPQKWLLEPTGIVPLLFGDNVPAFLTGPSLALIIIMIYTTWTYIGYDAAVFLAGLGNISPELYEAARIDGASGWSIFRYITLPLLSPTTFFLSLIAVIGTFQAFTQIWIMRTPASQKSVDTLGVHIFETVRNTDPNMGYGSAMAFVLFGVILLLTLFQNRVMGSKVFYG
jgi:multiple sugar transport system permease protein